MANATKKIADTRLTNFIIHFSIVLACSKT
jgi:hypothetical protein